MTKSVAFSLIIGMVFMLSTIVLVQPSLVSDKNLFLKDFIGSNLLNVLGVILAITLASSAQLHLELNKAEERHGRAGFKKSRSSIRGANVGLIIMFVLAVSALVIKSAASDSDRAQAAFNAVELFLLFMNVLFLAELTQAAFSIKAHFPIDPPALVPPAPTRQDRP